jgi:enterochelin esterase-like enzyme
MWFFSSFVLLTWQVQEINIYSNFLKRDVKLTIIAPLKKGELYKNVSLMLFNDGQDFPALQMQNTIENLYSNKKIKAALFVGIHANQDRLQEYGTASQSDYAGRGSKAQLHASFVTQELLPYLQKTYFIKKGAKNTYFAGFSLGGLSAIDIVWANPTMFSKVGVFSGSLWWRDKKYESHFKEDNDRIMHNIIKKGKYQKGLKFWFEAGTEDEKDDRNNNGIIDAIEDTLDLIKILNEKGYHSQKDVIYHEVQGGEHNPQTWAKVMPVFLEWALKK